MALPDDPFAGFGGAPGGPYITGAAVTKSDTVDFPKVASALWVGGTGNVVVVMADGTVLTFTAVPAGTLLKVRCIRVNSTNTTATNMVWLA